MDEELKALFIKGKRMAAGRLSRMTTQNASIAAAAMNRRKTDEARKSFASVPTLLYIDCIIIKVYLRHYSFTSTQSDTTFC